MNQDIKALASERNLVVAAFVVGLLTILGAWGFQLIGGYQPCELCYAQRIPYYWGLPIALAAILVWPRAPKLVLLIATVLVFAIFAWSAYLGTYHAGVEWGLWPGPTSCTGLGNLSKFGNMTNLNSTRVVPCDVAQWRFLGLSFAGYNGLISAFVALLSGASAVLQIKSLRQR